MDFLIAVLALSTCAVDQPMGPSSGASSVQIAPATTPAQAVEAAAVDLAGQPLELRKHLRYLWVGNLPEKEWADAWRTMSFHVNSLSVESEIVMPRVLPCKTVAAISLIDYGPNWKTTWEKLEDREPYFHVRLIKVTEKKVRDSETGKTTTKKEEKAETLLAPWVEGPALKALVEGTQSRVPILRADHFLWTTAIAADRGDVSYYSWLGIKDQKSYEELIGFDPVILKRFPIALREVVIESAVTLQPRRIERFGKIGGAYWLSSDVKAPKGKSNPMQFLNGDFEPHAHEGIATLPNELHVYVLFDTKGKLVDSAPPEIASDFTAHSNDKRVHIFLSCVSCHSNGINPVNGFVRNLAQKPLSLSSPDFLAAKKLQRLYFTPMEPIIDNDIRDYSRAVSKATGLKPVENAQKHRAMYAAYDSPLSADVAAGELGVTKEELVKAIRNAATVSPEVDPVLGSLLSDKNRIPRQAWEESFAKANLMVRPK